MILRAQGSPGEGIRGRIVRLDIGSFAMISEFRNIQDACSDETVGIEVGRI